MKTIVLSRAFLTKIPYHDFGKVGIFTSKGTKFAKRLYYRLRGEAWSKYRIQVVGGLYYIDESRSYKLKIKESQLILTKTRESDINPWDKLKTNAEEYFKSAGIVNAIKWMVRVEQSRIGYDPMYPMKIIELQERGEVSND